MRSTLLGALLLASVASCYGYYFYAAESVSSSPKLYLIDSDTGRLNVIGNLVDNDGNKFTAHSLVFLPETGKLYGVPTNRASNNTLKTVLMRIDPATARVEAYCKLPSVYASNYGANAIGYNTDTEMFYILPTYGTFLGSMTKQDFIDLNCSAIVIENSVFAVELYSTPFQYIGNGSFLMPYEETYYPSNLFVRTVSPLNTYRTITINRNPLVGDGGESLPYGDMEMTPDGTVWGLIRNWQRQETYFYKLSNISSDTATTEFVNPRLPRAMNGLAYVAEPVNKGVPYSTGVAGYAAMLTANNELWVVDLQNLGAVNVTTLSVQMLTIASAGLWDQVYGVANYSTSYKLVKIDTDTGAVIDFALLPEPIVSLKYDIHRNIFSALSVANETSYSNVYIISLSGVSPSVISVGAVLSTGKHAAVAGELLMLSGKDTDYVRLNDTDLTAIGGVISVTSGSDNIVGNWFSNPGISYFNGAVEHPTAGPLALVTDSLRRGHIAQITLSSGVVTPLVDLVEVAHKPIDFAYFLRDNSYCNSQGNFIDNRECSCTNGYSGARCMTPPPPPPVDAPVDVPVEAPVEAPVAAPAMNQVPVGEALPPNGAGAMINASLLATLVSAIMMVMLL